MSDFAFEWFNPVILFSKKCRCPKCSSKMRLKWAYSVTDYITLDPELREKYIKDSTEGVGSIVIHRMDLKCKQCGYIMKTKKMEKWIASQIEAKPMGTDAHNVYCVKCEHEERPYGIREYHKIYKREYIFVCKRCEYKIRLNVAVIVIMYILFGILCLMGDMLLQSMMKVISISDMLKPPIYAVGIWTAYNFVYICWYISYRVYCSKMHSVRDWIDRNNDFLSNKSDLPFAVNKIKE